MAYAVVAAVRVLNARPHRPTRCVGNRGVKTAVRWRTHGTEPGCAKLELGRMVERPRAPCAGYSDTYGADGYEPTTPSPPRANALGRTRRVTTTPDVLPVKVLVECAMLSALTGLLFHLSTLFRVDAWFGALFPLPVVIAAARHGTNAATRVAIVTTLLLFILSGPLRAANYVFLHGAMAYSLGAMWNAKFSWWVTVPVSALVRSAGIFSSLAFSSLILRENVMKLLVTQMFGLLDQISANVGATFAPSMSSVWACAIFFVLLNSLSYVGILHAVYAIVLRAVGGVDPEYVNAPDRVKKILGVPPYGPGR